MEKFVLTPDQAISMLADGNSIHTYRSHPMALVGADWDRSKIINGCKSMNHGLVVHVDGSPLFVECKEGFDYDEFERTNGPEAASGDAARQHDAFYRSEA